MTKTLSFLLFFSVSSTACKHKTDSAAMAPTTVPTTEPTTTPAMAVATISPKSGSNVTGTVTFTATDNGTQVNVEIAGLTPGSHGFHIHETGDCTSPDGKSAGGHYNPTQVNHGSPDSDTHHRGDLGNIEANANGEATKTLVADFFSITDGAEDSVLGRAVIVHANPDDLKTQPTGAAGARVGCGVITAQ